MQLRRIPRKKAHSWLMDHDLQVCDFKLDLKPFLSGRHEGLLGGGAAICERSERRCVYSDSETGWITK